MSVTTTELKRDAELNLSTLEVGKVSDGGYTEFDSAGKLIMYGDATVHNIIDVPASAIRLDTTTYPTWTAYKGGQVLAFGGVDDELIYFNVIMPSDYKEGSKINFHIHCTGDVDSAGNVAWNFSYSFANIGSAFAAATTVGVSSAMAGNADQHEVHEIFDVIGSGKEIDSVMICSLMREGRAAGDTYSGNVFVTNVAFYYECDTLGADEEFVK